MMVEQVFHEVITFNKKFEIKYKDLPKKQALIKCLRLTGSDQNDFVVQQIRKSVLPFLEVKTTERQQLDAYVKAVQALNEIQIADNNPCLKMHVAHTKAKLYYQIATMALQTRTAALIQDYFSDQSNATIYTPVQPGDGESNGVASDDSCVNQNLKDAIYFLKKALEQYSEDPDAGKYKEYGLDVLDDYLPEQRLLSILCQLKTCEMESTIDFSDVTTQLPENLKLKGYLEVSLDHAFNEYRSLCEVFINRAVEPRIKDHYQAHIDEINQIYPKEDSAGSSSLEGSSSQPVSKKRKATGEDGDSASPAAKNPSTANECQLLDLKSQLDEMLANPINEPGYQWILNEPDSFKGKLLREDQQIYVTQTLHAYKKCGKETCGPALISLPTGYGKSRILYEFIQRSVNSGKPAILIAPSIDLVDQHYDELMAIAQIYPELGLTDKVAKYSPTKNSRDMGPITIMTQMSFLKLCQKKALQLDKYFLAVDEAHHLNGKKTYEELKHYQNTSVIGVSASTVDIEKKDVYQKLADFFTLKPVNITFKDAVNMGVLSPVYLATLQFQMYREAKDLQRRIKDLGDDEANKKVSEFLTTKMGFSYTACHVFLEYMKMGNESEQGLVFTSSIEHAEQLSTLLSHMTGTPVPAYHTQSKDPKQIIQDFKSGKFPILVTVGKVDEGFDHPLIKFILDFRVYKHSVRRLEQSVGRGTRLLEGGSPCFVLSLQIFKLIEQIIPRTYYEESVILGPGNTNKSLRDLVDPTLPGDITDKELLQKIFGKDDVKSICPSPARLLNPSAKGMVQNIQ